MFIKRAMSVDMALCNLKGDLLHFDLKVDGFGNHTFMDDANVPSILALPYIDLIDKNDKIYQNTRNLIWSDDNPYFFKGKAAEGIGGPHITITI